MMIFVKSLTARTIALDVDLGESLASVSRKIQVRRPERRLVLGGAQ